MDIHGKQCTIHFKQKTLYRIKRSTQVKSKQELFLIQKLLKDKQVKENTQKESNVTICFYCKTVYCNTTDILKTLKLQFNETFNCI